MFEFMAFEEPRLEEDAVFLYPELLVRLSLVMCLGFIQTETKNSC